ncbi:MAG: hypothetical protein BWX55_00568 [Deltaproteobacteria bacterium ADurb.Bin022]|nr:MAG: hypothetical protein BWX55_00568 [Deltaproteobacteria bacterium ADurb.Bin022]
MRNNIGSNHTAFHIANISNLQLNIKRLAFFIQYFKFHRVRNFQILRQSFHAFQKSFFAFFRKNVKCCKRRYLFLTTADIFTKNIIRFQESSGLIIDLIYSGRRIIKKLSVFFFVLAQPFFHHFTLGNVNHDCNNVAFIINGDQFCRLETLKHFAAFDLMTHFHIPVSSVSQKTFFYFFTILIEPYAQC